MIFLDILTKETGMSYGPVDSLHLRLLIWFTTSLWRTGVKCKELWTEEVEGVTYTTSDEITDTSLVPLR